jgi:hypothetical protein
MRTSTVGTEGSSGPSTEALLGALQLAGWKGVGMTLQDYAGANYRINAPIIIGSNFVQFATGASLRPVRVPFDQIAAFELL